VIVRCIATTGEALPAMSRDSSVGVADSTEFPVTIGRPYPVFAITIYLGVAWYYVLDDDGREWPTWVPAPLFEIVDGSLPAGWKVGYFNFGRDDQYPIVSFPEWAEDHLFYERLVDGDATAVQVFARRRQEIEAPDPAGRTAPS
jgi:hypothetical protein